MKKYLTLDINNNVTYYGNNKNDAVKAANSINNDAIVVYDTDYNSDNEKFEELTEQDQIYTVMLFGEYNYKYSEVE